MSKPSLDDAFLILESEIQRRRIWRKQPQAYRSYARGTPVEESQEELKLGQTDSCLNTLPVHPSSIPPSPTPSTPQILPDISSHEPPNPNRYWPTSRKSHPHFKQTLHTFEFQHPLNSCLKQQGINPYEWEPEIIPDPGIPGKLIPIISVEEQDFLRWRLKLFKDYDSQNAETS